MKNLCFILLLALIGTSSAEAQRGAFVDMERVMDAIPAYSQAQKQLEETAERWRQELAKNYDEIERMYTEYQAKEPLMGDDARKEKQDEIMEKEKAARSLQAKRFGPEGELFKKRQTLVKPIQEKVYKAVEDYAKTRNFDFVFTAPDGSTVIFAKADKDITDEVIKRVKK